MDNNRAGSSERKRSQSKGKGKGKGEPETSRWPTREERRAAWEHLDAMHADVDRFMEETLREVEEDKKAGRQPDPAEIDMDLWKRRYARIIRDHPPPEYLLSGVAAAEYLKYLEED